MYSFSPKTVFGLIPVPTKWFLPHAGLQLATAHFRSQELEHGRRYRPVSPRRLSLSLSLSLSLFIPATSENAFVSATTASIIFNTLSWSWILMCFALSTTFVAYLNWIELYWTDECQFYVGRAATIAPNTLITSHVVPLILTYWRRWRRWRKNEHNPSF